MLRIFTDGAYKSSKNVGGWGWVIFDGAQNLLAQDCGGAYCTTNNRMELQAAIQVLLACNSLYVDISHISDKRIILYTDSQYLLKGITQWIIKWKKKNYRSVKNADLWQQLDELNKKHEIKWKWVRSHSGNFGNEIADQLANDGVDGCIAGV